MRSVILVCLLCLSAAPAFPWGRAGHQIVCAIAWDELTPAARDRVKSILVVETREQFAPLCTWADNYRFYHGETTGWHFVNVPPGETAVDLQRDCSSQDSCVIAQILADAEALRHPTSETDQATTLKFLVHFVGDVHQPLHASYGRDRGGVDIKGVFMGRAMHLHQVWDSGIINADGRTWEQLTEVLESEITSAQRAQWTSSTPLAWANKSLAIALAPATGYEHHGDAFELDADYARQQLPTVLERLKQAGVRLGAVLDRALR